MIDKGHCKMEYDGDADLEYAEFYDFGQLEDEDHLVDTNDTSDECI